MLILLTCEISCSQKTLSIIKSSPDSAGNDGCGDPAVESTAYAYRNGLVTEIISANEIVFEQDEAWGSEANTKFTVTLIGIDPDYNENEIKDFLTNFVLNKRIEILANLRKKTDKIFNGEITLLIKNAEYRRVNEYLLERGIAKFKDFKADYLVPYITPCLLRKAEERAKNAKLGIWAK